MAQRGRNGLRARKTPLKASHLLHGHSPRVGAIDDDDGLRGRETGGQHGEQLAQGEWPAGRGADYHHDAGGLLGRPYGQSTRWGATGILRGTDLSAHAPYHLDAGGGTDRKSTRLNSSHLGISY